MKPREVSSHVHHCRMPSLYSGTDIIGCAASSMTPPGKTKFQSAIGRRARDARTLARDCAARRVFQHGCDFSGTHPHGSISTLLEY